MRLALSLISSLAATSAAGDFSLTFPIDCTLDDICFIQQFVDHDPTAGVHDFTCGALSYDGHKGTDFALPSRAAQRAGVNVLAAAAGKVLGVRNDMQDILQTSPDAPDVSDRECGNGLVIAHENGFETQYCHMKRGSITVKAGQSVAANTVLGQVGLSGQTQFPHLHLSVRKDGQTVDPFDTDGAQTCPNTQTPTLWDTTLPAPAGGIVNIGISQTVPTFDAIKQGVADTGARADGSGLVGWVHLFGTRGGDIVSFTMTGPDGITFSSTDTLPRNQARAFRASGRRTPATGWTKGAYTLDISLTRADQQIDHETRHFTLD